MKHVSQGVYELQMSLLSQCFEKSFITKAKNLYLWFI